MQKKKELPKGWIWTTIGELARTSSGGTPSRKNPHYFTGHIPWVKSGELGDGYVKNCEEFITEDAVANSSAKVFPKHTLLVALYGATVGKVGILTMDATTNQAVCGIFLPESVELQYAFNYLISIRRELIAQGKGGAQPNISQDIVRSIPFPLAPLPEQRRIVAKLEELFSRLDAGVATLRRTQAQLKRYRQSVLHAAVTGELTRPWREAHPQPEETGEDLLARIRQERRAQWEAIQVAKRGGQFSLNDAWKKKYEEPAAPDTSGLPDLPKGWTWTGFAQVAALEAYALKAGPFGSALKKEYYVSSGYKIYGQEQVIRQDANYGDYFIDEARYESLKSCAVKPGDILISLVGTIGKVLVLPDGILPGIINPRLVKLSLDNQTIRADFAKIYIDSPIVKSRFSTVSHGGTMDILNLSTLRELPVPLPSLAEQDFILLEVDRLFSALDHVEQALKVELVRSERLRQSILHRAFTGKLVPQNATDEPAAALLARLDQKPAAQPAAKAKRGRKAKDSIQIDLSF
ncbi:restriction endonuclease subunit S [Hymenobacter sp. HD11105]